MERRAWIVGIVLAAACGGTTTLPDEPEVGGKPDPVPATFAEYCGSTEPTLLMTLGPDEYPTRNLVHGIQRVGDRLVIITDTYPAGFEFPGSSGDAIATTIYSTGLCGEDPLILSEDIGQLFDSRHEFAAEIVGCRLTNGDVVVLDPSGAVPEWSALETVGCAALPAGEGMVGVQRHAPDSETGDLLFRESLSPGAEVLVLAADVLAPFVSSLSLWADLRRLRTTGNDVLSLSPDGEIWTYDVSDGTSKLELSNVRGFELTYDGGFILWQEGPPAVVGETWDARPTRLYDRSTGENLELGTAQFGSLSSGVQPGMVRATTDYKKEDTLIVLVPELEQFAFGPEQIVHGRHPTGELYWSKTPSPQPLHLFDPETEESIEVFDRDGNWIAEPNRIWLVATSDEDEEQSDLWKRELDEDEATIVVSNVFQPIFLGDDKVATVRDSGEDRHGTLIAVDIETGHQSIIGEEVNAYAAAINWLDGLGDDGLAWAVREGGTTRIYAGYPQ